ncbi:MAG: bifunctional riboflavin kinase/FAD synthetase [Ferruginibacter sp.]
MQVYTNVQELPKFKKAVVTIGTFDGVHLGHVKIIQQLLAEARAIGGTAVLITFFPHPKQVVRSNKNRLYMLSTQEEKYQLLQKQGLEHIVVVPFDEAFAEQSAEQYIKDFLVSKFHPHTIIIGYDHRFGKGRQGNFSLLENEAANYSYRVKEIPEHVLENVIISSTKVRDALLDGDIKTAADYLGYHYAFSGTVIPGNKLGRTIGYPTANISINDENKLVPGNAVYAVDVELRKKLYKGMMNIGNRPTVNGKARVIEVNIFDLDEDIYGETLRITLKKQLRSEQKFNGIDALKVQLAKDKISSIKANP